MKIDVEKIAKSFPPEGYMMRMGEMLAIYDHCPHDFAQQISIAYNYGFMRGQRAEKAHRKKAARGEVTA